MSIIDSFSGGLHSFANWLAPVPVKEEPKVEPQIIFVPVAPKEKSFMEKAEAVTDGAIKVAKILGTGLIAFATLYGALDKGTKGHAGKTGSVLEVGGLVSKFLLNDDTDAGKKGLSTIISMATNKPSFQTFSGKIIDV